jgi:hypothetical protein
MDKYNIVSCNRRSWKNNLLKQAEERAAKISERAPKENFVNNERRKIQITVDMQRNIIPGKALMRKVGEHKK